MPFGLFFFLYVTRINSTHASLANESIDALTMVQKKVQGGREREREQFFRLCMSESSVYALIE